MKKLLLIGIIFVSGCQNPIASRINKEGDKTRVTLQSELASAKQEISAENQAMLEQLAQQFNNSYSTIIDYLNFMLTHNVWVSR